MESELSLKLKKQILSQDIFKDIDDEVLLYKYPLFNDGFDSNYNNGGLCIGTPVTSNNISNIPSEGITITTPGLYTFSNDIEWSPGEKNCTAITISGENVILDMNGYCLSASPLKNSNKISGIVVDSMRNISILNGCIKNLCYSGISISHSSNITVENIAVDGLNFIVPLGKKSSVSGISIQHSSNIHISNCQVKNLIVKAGACAGIQLRHSELGIVSGCLVSTIHNGAGSSQGYSLMYCQGITTSNCEATDLQSKYSDTDVAVGHTVIGFISIVSKDLIYNNCTSNKFQGCCDDCHGMSAFLVMNVLVNNFYAYDITDGFPTGGAKATGLEVYGVGVHICDSHVKNVKAIMPKDKQCAGFSAAGLRIHFTNCKSENVSVVDCDGREEQSIGYGMGFGWAPDPRPALRILPALNVVYQKCTANGCQVGFDTWYHVDSTWVGNDTINCTIDMLIEPKGTRSLSGDKCSECNPSITTELVNFECGNIFKP